LVALLQVAPAAQSLSLAQAVLQEDVALSQAKLPSQGFGLGSTHRPALSQVPAACSTLPEHEAGAQGVPVEGLLQVGEVPSQKAAQAPSPGQDLPEGGDWLAGTTEQVPRFPRAAQVVQGSRQGESQHTPSTQKPLSHCSAPEQDLPLVDSSTQVPSSHRKPLAQSFFVVQVVKQASALQA
jgi:hypothetical protein